MIQRYALIQRQQRLLALLACLPMVLLVLSCAVGPDLTASSGARWACPSPTPKPYGDVGPVKGHRDSGPPDPITGEVPQEPIYYEQWEQEYGSLGGPPFPAPTPYGMLGTRYVLGQRVEVWPLHALVTARAGAPVDYPGIATGSQQLYLVTIQWYNHADAPMPISYGDRVRLRAIKAADGRVLTDDTWGMTEVALEVA